MRPRDARTMLARAIGSLDNSCRAEMQTLERRQLFAVTAADSESLKVDLSATTTDDAAPVTASLATTSTAGLTASAVGEVTSSLWGRAGELFDATGRLMDWSYAGYGMGEKPLPSSYSVTVNVRNFGAKGDGSTDDTSAVKRALADLHSRIGSSPSTPGQLFFPAGKYVIRQELRITKSHIAIRGEGQGRTELHFPRSLGSLYGGADGDQSDWTARGGMIWVQGDEQPVSTIGTVTTGAKRGASSLTLSSVTGLSVGQRVRLMLTDDSSGTLLRHLHADLASGGSGLDPDEKTFMGFAPRVKSISGRTVTFDRALPVDVRTNWRPRIDRYRPTLENIGVEGLTISFPSVRMAEHHHEKGYNGIYFRKMSDGWVRDVRVHNADSAVLLSRSFNVTVTGARLTHFGTSGRANSQGFVGHHGLSTNTLYDSLITNFYIDGEWHHGLDVDRSFGVVFSNGGGSDLNMGHHRLAPYSNLFTDLDLGAASEPFRTAGRKDRGPYSAAYGTFWNITGDRNIGLPTVNLGPKLAFVGVEGAGTTPSFAQQWHVERMAPESLYPQNLHEAMVARRLKPTTPSNAAPTVSLTHATTAAVLASPPAAVDLRATASDADGAVSKVEFFQGSAKIGEDATAPYALTTAALPAGSYTFSARAIDDDGAAGTSAPLAVRVGSEPTPVETVNPIGTSWRNFAVATPSSGTYTVRYSVTPNGGSLDAVSGLTAVDAGAYASLATTLRTAPDGYFDARNGDNFAKTTALRYAAGQRYNVRMVVDPSRRRYSVYVAPANGGAEVLVANDFAFRTGSPTGRLRNLAAYAKSGTFGLVTPIGVVNG